MTEQNRNKWLRFPCPFCGKERAAINYALDLFVCYHADCRVRIWAKHRFADPAGYLPHRFQFQVDQAVRNVRAKWGRWIDDIDARDKGEDAAQYARQRLIEYDSGSEMDNWESKVDGNPDQLDRFVLRALNCDLHDWAKKLKRQRERLSLTDPQYMESEQAQLYSKEMSPEDNAIWRSWPLLELRFRYGYTNREIADALGVSTRTVDRRMAEELAEAEKTIREERGL